MSRNRKTTTRSLQESQTPAKVLGRIIRTRRQELGLAQADLEGDADFHQTYISKLEQGEREPRLSTIIHLERALQLPPGELVRLVRIALEGENGAGKNSL